MYDIFLHRYQSPIGIILYAINQSAELIALDYLEYEPRMLKLLQKGWGNLQLHDVDRNDTVYDCLQRYFKGDLQACGNIPLQLQGTEFQRATWNALRDIPAGQTRTYKEIAQQIGKPQAYRAVGMTNSLNPIAIVIPCHRVIGSDAALTGYAGGLHRKAWLLQHEKFLQPDAHIHAEKDCILVQ